jgi:shikimate kinase
MAKSMIINIRGTNGSGKSTIARSFLQRAPYTEIFGSLGPKRAEAYMVRLPRSSSHVIPKWLYLIGPYQTATGGVDALPLSSDELVAMLERYHRRCKTNTPGHMLFEGVVISTYFGAVGEFLVRNKLDSKVVYLDTPLQTCLNSISKRSGDSARVKNVEAKIKAIQSTRARLEEAGVSTTTLSRDGAFEEISRWLNEW